MREYCRRLRGKMAADNITDPYSVESLKNARVSRWYDAIAKNVTKCVFCDLKEKYIVAEKGSEVLTVSLFPYIDGQLMVIPRRHIETLEEISADEWQNMLALITAGERLIKEVTGVENINVLYREGKAGAGKSVGHLHVNIFPVTPEFMSYRKDFGFEWRFQQITVSPLEMAARMRDRLASRGSSLRSE